MSWVWVFLGIGVWLFGSLSLGLVIGAAVHRRDHLSRALSVAADACNHCAAREDRAERELMTIAG